MTFLFPQATVPPNLQSLCPQWSALLSESGEAETHQPFFSTNSIPRREQTKARRAFSPSEKKNTKKEKQRANHIYVSFFESKPLITLYVSVVIM